MAVPRSSAAPLSRRVHARLSWYIATDFGAGRLERQGAPPEGAFGQAAAFKPVRDEGSTSCALHPLDAPLAVDGWRRFVCAADLDQLDPRSWPAVDFATYLRARTAGQDAVNTVARRAKQPPCRYCHPPHAIDAGAVGRLRVRLCGESWKPGEGSARLSCARLPNARGRSRHPPPRYRAG